MLSPTAFLLRGIFSMLLSYLRLPLSSCYLQEVEVLYRLGNLGRITGHELPIGNTGPAAVPLGLCCHRRQWIPAAWG